MKQILSQVRIFCTYNFSPPNLTPGDKLVVSSPDGTRAWLYTSCGVNGNGDFWAFAQDQNIYKALTLLISQHVIILMREIEQFGEVLPESITALTLKNQWIRR
jgi:hypothetical protein